MFFINTNYMKLNAELNYRTTRNVELRRLSGITELDIPKNYFIGMIKKFISTRLQKTKQNNVMGITV